MLIKTLLRPQENDENLLDPEAPYLSVIETLILLIILNLILHLL